MNLWKRKPKISIQKSGWMNEKVRGTGRRSVFRHARRADWQAIGLQQVIRAGAVAKRRSAVHQQVTAKVPEPHSAAAASEPATSEAASKGAGRRGDRLDRHFAPALAERLRRAALETLGDVATADISGREWWAMAPGIGPLRAREIAERVRGLLGSAQ